MIRKNQQLNWQGQPPPTPNTPPTDKISLALLSGISSFPALLHLLTPRGHYTLQTCSKEPLPPLLPSSPPTRDQPPSAPCPRPNSRTDGSMAILFWVTFQKHFQGTDSHRQSSVQDEPRGGGWFDTNLSLPSHQVT